MTKQDLILCFTYLPPTGSPFYFDRDYKGIDLLDNLLRDLNVNLNCNLVIIGDLNARTANRQDSLSDSSGAEDLLDHINILDGSHFKKESHVITMLILLVLN